MKKSDEIKVPPKVKKPKGENQLVKKYKEVVESTKKVIHGLENLILSASLVIVSFYNIYDLLNRPVDNFEYYVRAFASLVIALVGAGAIIKVFKALGENK
jgi:hypothetical protein